MSTPNPVNNTSSKAHFPAYIDSTMASTFRTCPQAFYNEYILCLGESAISVHLHAGGALAAAFETVYKHYFAPNTEPDAEAAMRAGFRRLCRYYGDFVPSDKDKNKGFSRVAPAFTSYFEQWPLATDPLKPYRLESGEPAMEFTFSIPTEIEHPETGDPILYVGRVDSFRQTESGMLVLVDEKSTGSISGNWSSKWGLRAQFIGYMFAARSHGFDVGATYVRGIALQMTDIKFAEAIVHYKDWLAQRWWRQLHIDITRMVACWRTEQYDYRLDDACTQYGRCTYYDVCNSRDPEPWRAVLVPRHWNPLAKDPTETFAKVGGTNEEAA